MGVHALINQHLLKLRVIRTRCASSASFAGKTACQTRVPLSLVGCGVRLVHDGYRGGQFCVLQLDSASFLILVIIAYSPLEADLDLDHLCRRNFEVVSCLTAALVVQSSGLWRPADAYALVFDNQTPSMLCG